MSDRLPPLSALSWPAERLGEGLVALAGCSRLQPEAREMPTPAGDPGRWLPAAAARLGLEAETVLTTYGRLDHLLRHGAPAILRLDGDHAGELAPAAGQRYLLLIAGGRQTVTLLGPDLVGRRRPRATVRAGLTRHLEERLAPDVARVLEATGIPARRRPRARYALLAQRLDPYPIAAGWRLHPSPGAGAWSQIRHAGLLRHLFTFAGAYTAQHLLFLLAWWLIGRGALQGRLESGWLWTWAFLLLSIVPFRLLFTRAQGMLAVHAGARLKRRLLYGALRLAPDEIRHQGAGQLLGRVIESEAIESLALNGGFLGVVALVELLFAGFVLAAGAAGPLHLMLLLAWLLLGGLLVRRYYRRRARWTETRLAMTHDLVEQMVGHRTRLVQEAPEQRHQAEDRLLARYLQLSQAADNVTIPLSALLPRGWLWLGLLGLAPAFVGGVSDTAALALGLGGVLLAWRALRRLSRSLADLGGAAIAWHQVAPLYHAAARPVDAGSPAAAPVVETPTGATPLLEGRSLAFSYPTQPTPAVRPCSFRLGHQARVLLQGPSGAGKSTLVALLAGLRRPVAGSLHLYGFDLQSIGGEAWRQHVAAAPQFNENHVLTSTLAFNLLMGRGWPAAPQALQEAEALCHELGLGPLLAAMPAGLLQMVGESGWQLSHGERSRLYLARALLQNARLVILDESFAALDPENLRHALAVAHRRAPALVVITHT